MKCQNCGELNDNSAAICAKCRTALTEATQTKTFPKNSASSIDDHPTPVWGSQRFGHILVIQLNGKTIKSALVGRKPIVIGRKTADFSPDVDLSEHGAYEKGVSRKHVEVQKIADGLVIRDVGSANGTILNGSQVLEANRTYQLNDGAEIRMGQMIIRVYFR